MQKSNKAFSTGDLVKKYRWNEDMTGLVLEALEEAQVRVMWETGTATIEVEDELDHVATAENRIAYLIEGKRK